MIEVVRRLKAGNVLVVSRERSFNLSGASRVFGEIEKSGVLVSRFGDFSENPKIEDISKGVSLIASVKPDLVVAIGGGSAIDTAKLVNFFPARGVTAEQYISGNTGVNEKCRPFIAIPTTAGSGSEATGFAVLYVDKKKYSVEHPSLRPLIAILDPDLTLSLPGAVIASSGIDALSQAVESYWSVNSNTESKMYAEEAVNALSRNMADAFSRKSPAAMAAMMEEAYLSGKAINITRTTAPHAISYALTSHYGVSHGQAVGLLLPSFFEYNYNVTEQDCADKRGVSYVRETLRNICLMFGCGDPVSAGRKIRALMSEIGLKTRLSQLGVREGPQIELLVENVNAERLMNNPRIVTKKSVRELLTGMI